jgi:selenocysteine lyase/cysteine desulfurase
VQDALNREAIARWRAETPACERRIHLNNAGASLMPTRVQAAISAHLALEAEIGGYEASDAASAEIAKVYDELGRLVGGKAHNIAIVASATHAFAQALSSFDFAPGDAILTSSDDYVSNQLMYLSLARRCGVRIVRCPDAPEGGVDLAAWERLLRGERFRVAALTWIPTNGGLIQPAAQVGALCRMAGVPYLLDACQAVGQLEVDLASLQCDFLSTTARKFLRGPRGIGFLAVSDEALARGDAPLLVDMRGARWVEADAYRLVDDAKRFEAWELPHALVLAMGAAACYAHEVGIGVASQRAHALARFARERFTSIRGVRGLDHGAQLSAITTYTLEGRVARELVLALRKVGINTSAQSREDALIDLDRKGASTLLRVSPHYYNTEDEIERAASALEDLLR